MKNNNNSLFDMYGTNDGNQGNKDELNKVNQESNEILDNTIVENNNIGEQNIENKHENNVTPQNDESQYENNVGDNTDDLLKLYIGNNYEDIVAGNFSYCSFFFGVYYMFYRKQYTISLILFLMRLGIIISYGLLYEKLNGILTLVYYVVCFLIGLGFKRNYVENAKKQINKITSENNDSEEQYRLVKKVGGVDKRVILMIVLLMIINVTIDLTTFMYLREKSIEVEIHFPEQFKENTTIDDHSYMAGEYYQREMNIHHSTDNNDCYFDIKSNDEYHGDDKLNLAKQYLAKQYLLNVDLEEVQYGNNNYYYYYSEKDKKDYYVYFSSNDLILMTVLYKKDTDNKCREYADYILNNLKRIK